MKKFYILAALLMATTSAHAGNGFSFEIGGQRVRIEAPRNCADLSCIKVSAPGLKGVKSKPVDDDIAVNSQPSKAPAAPAPVQAAEPQSTGSVANTAPAPTTMASNATPSAPIMPGARPTPAPAPPSTPPPD